MALSSLKFQYVMILNNIDRDIYTAMGPILLWVLIMPIACSYTDIAVDKTTDNRVSNSQENPWNNCIALWSRFRDDIFCIGTGS